MTTPHVPAAMEPLPKRRLHELVDELPENEIRAAERYLEFLCACQDPLIRALESAPEDDESITDEEREAVEEAERALAEGEVVSDAHVRINLGP